MKKRGKARQAAEKRKEIHLWNRKLHDNLVIMEMFLLFHRLFRYCSCSIMKRYFFIKTIKNVCHLIHSFLSCLWLWNIVELPTTESLKCLVHLNLILWASLTHLWLVRTTKNFKTFPSSLIVCTPTFRLRVTWNEWIENRLKEKSLRKLFFHFPFRSFENFSLCLSQFLHKL